GCAWGGGEGLPRGSEAFRRHIRSLDRGIGSGERRGTDDVRRRNAIECQADAKEVTGADFKIENAATTEGVPIAPAAGAAIQAARVPLERALIDRRVLMICAWSILLAIATGFVAQALVGIIGLVTNLAFYGRFSTQFVSPANNHLGWLVLFIPAI